MYPGLFGGNTVEVPHGAGLGLEPDPRALERYRA